ncbi:hypothetical protein DWV12_18025 [Clostridium botulinum]|nr:hypothetical protein [Clostridium botulinum]
MIVKTELLIVRTPLLNLNNLIQAIKNGFYEIKPLRVSPASCTVQKCSVHEAGLTFSFHIALDELHNGSSFFTF